MNGRGHLGCDGRGDQGDGHSGGHWNDNGGGHNVGAIETNHNDGGQGAVVVMLVPLEQIIMMEDKVLKWLARVMLQAEIMVISMVVDLVVEHIIIDYLGCRHCLLVLFMDLSKR
jgi:hypothetical protein